MTRFYRYVEIDDEGNSKGPVNFVGVHPLSWDRYDMPSPDAGFVEAPEIDDMLEACKQVLKLLEFHHMADEGRIGRNDAERLRAAIAKVEHQERAG